MLEEQEESPKKQKGPLLDSCFWHFFLWAKLGSSSSSNSGCENRKKAREKIAPRRGNSTVQNDCCQRRHQFIFINQIHAISYSLTPNHSRPAPNSTAAIAVISYRSPYLGPFTYYIVGESLQIIEVKKKLASPS